MIAKGDAPERAPDATRLLRRALLATGLLSLVALACAARLAILPSTQDMLAAAAAAALALGCFGLLWRLIGELAAREASASMLAGHDLLSGLANRRLFTDWLDYEVARRQRERTQFALLYLDVDRFKEVNDRYGHEAGDQLISAFAKRVAAIIRPTDRFGRLGGDEFAIMQIGVQDTRDAEALAARIIASMREPFRLAHQELATSVSIGIALCPDNSAERDELMHLADLALYRAKREGRNRYAFFDARMSEEVERRVLFERDLIEAIPSGGLKIDYKPVASGQDGRLVAYEAQLRWPHPQRGLVEAADILPVADQRGFALRLYDWQFRRMFADAASWPALPLSAAISPGLFKHRDFVTHLRQALQESSIDPTRVELMLTEDCVLDAPDAALAVMKGLHADGVRFAIARFGAGIASLDHLHKFPFTRVKIDRTCVSAGQHGSLAAVLLHANIQLARNLGMVVRAEGVDTEEQAHVLTALGCHELQGRFIGQPREAATTAHRDTEAIG